MGNLFRESFQIVTSPKMAHEGRFLRQLFLRSLVPVQLVVSSDRKSLHGSDSDSHPRMENTGIRRLDDLSIVLVADLGEGVIWKGGWRAGVIFDEKANPSQRDALATIMTGKAGGAPAMIASLIKEMVGVEYAPISFRYSKDGWGVSVGGGKVDVQTEATKDSSGNVTQIHNAPVVETGTGPITIWKSKEFYY